MQTIARADPAYQPLGSVTDVRASATGISLDELDIGSTSLALGTERDVIVSGVVDFRMSAIAPPSVRSVTGIYEFASSFTMRLQWVALATSYSFTNQVLDQVFLFQEQTEYKPYESGMEGGFSSLGVMSGAYYLTVVVGGRTTLQMQLYSEIYGSTADDAYKEDVGRIDLTSSALNSFDLFVDAPSLDIQLTSNSGHDYASPVPEAPLWLMLVVGLITLSASRTSKPSPRFARRR